MMISTSALAAHLSKKKVTGAYPMVARISYDGSVFSWQAPQTHWCDDVWLSVFWHTANPAPPSSA